MLSINIPFCSSTINAEWNDPGFTTYLESQGANLGTLYADLKKQSRDFYIKSLNQPDVVSGECKYRSHQVGSQEIDDVIYKLMASNSSLNLIVVNALNKNINLKKDFSSNFRLYVASKNNNNQIDIKILYEYSKCNNTNTKISIVTEVNTNG